jgi:hypothetical protein
VIARCDEPAKPRLKSEPQRNPHLLAMAKDKPCLLMAVHNCANTRYDTSTTVACHGNSSVFGKSMGRKADDCYTVWGCNDACHWWLDQGKAPKAEKMRVFMVAHLRQVNEWRAIVFDKTQPEKDRKAAQWALDRLNATTVGEEA